MYIYTLHVSCSLVGDASAVLPHVQVYCTLIDNVHMHIYDIHVYTYAWAINCVKKKHAHAEILEMHYWLFFSK